MNRSKIFLSSTAALLSIARIAVAKSHKFVQFVTRYYCTYTPTVHFNPACLPVASNLRKVTTGGQTAYWTLGSAPFAIQYTLYTDFDGKDPVCKVANGASCGHKLIYSGVQ